MREKSNFKFLKQCDAPLYELIQEAEKLFADEYFEQCITQVRRFGENMCRNFLGESAQSSDSFDDLINIIKDKSNSEPQEKEFIEDMYFIKKQGNASVHNVSVKQDGNIALECLQRAFEASLNYAVFKKGANRKYLKLRFNEELLVLGTPSKKKTLKEKYIEKKEEYEEQEKSSVVQEYQQKQPRKAPEKKRKKEIPALNPWALILKICAVILLGAFLYLNANHFFDAKKQPEKSSAPAKYSEVFTRK